MPMRNVGYLLYHMAKCDIYDPAVYQGFEDAYKEISSRTMTSRHAMGGLYGYYRSNQGTKYGLDIWEELVQSNSAGLHVQDIAELTEAFTMNRTLPREYYRKKLDEVYKPILLAKWKNEATYHQRMLYQLCRDFHTL
jgi:hypothetical protein